MQASWSLDDVLDALAQHHERATYGAVGELLDRLPLFLMQGRPRDRRHSWIVTKASGLPSGYSVEERDPHLLDRDEILKSGSELEFWLRSLPQSFLLRASAPPVSYPCVILNAMRLPEFDPSSAPPA